MLTAGTRVSFRENYFHQQQHLTVESAKERVLTFPTKSQTGRVTNFSQSRPLPTLTTMTSQLGQDRLNSQSIIIKGKRSLTYEVNMTTEEASALLTLQRSWVSRAAEYRELTKVDRQVLQERFLVFLALEDLLPQFLECRDQLDWSYGTSSNYLSAVIKAAEILRVLLPVEVRIRAKLLNLSAKEEAPVRRTYPATQLHIDQVSYQLRAKGYLQAALAIELAFFLGQRIGDTLLLKMDALDTIVDLISTEYLVVVFVKGKTTRRRQPFCLHVPMGVEAPTANLAASLLKLQQTGLQSQHPSPQSGSQTLRNVFLFGDPLKEAERIKNEMSIVASETGVPLTLLSIRRGGLQVMACSGLSEAALLHHSRHTNVETLHRYLEWGKLAFHAARERFHVAQTTWERSAVLQGTGRVTH